MSPAHAMPFGAEWLPEGSTRFRLWAPALSHVCVRLHDSGERFPMAPVGKGWFELLTAAARPGSRYHFELPDGLHIPDPASRQQDSDVHGASIVVNPDRSRWRHPDWTGRPWREAVLYELHVGSFTSEGDFEGVRRRLPELVELGITGIELMPVADFAGGWNWGYDGVLPFAPDVRYGTAEDLKRLVDEAHGLGLMVLLDVVYNHFGPDGNYLNRYAPEFFTDAHRTPWGPAIDFTQEPVRSFFAHNAAYWIEEYRFDGLRLDAVHTILHSGTPHILQTIAEAARAAGAGRLVHLVLENDDNASGLIGGGALTPRRPYDAQWNDDFHHAAHVLLTGEGAAYYADYADAPIASLGRALAEGFAYQGEVSQYRRRSRGEATKGLPSTAFVNFLQNHDQIGNRGFGERLVHLADPSALAALSAILLLAPAIPMLFMGEEHWAPEPFLFFVDFHEALAEAVRNGRRREMKRHPGFRTSGDVTIPDPASEDSFRGSVIDWTRQLEPFHASRLAQCRRLLALRAREIVPRLARPPRAPAPFRVWPGGILTVTWELGTGECLTLVALLQTTSAVAPDVALAGRPLWMSEEIEIRDGQPAALPPWFVGWFLKEAMPSIGTAAAPG
jgi:maltooligosyltrehalose trehalohydrolase